VAGFHCGHADAAQLHKTMVPATTAPLSSRSDDRQQTSRMFGCLDVWAAGAVREWSRASLRSTSTQPEGTFGASEHPAQGGLLNAAKVTMEATGVKKR
jgi:hypothetical protein